MKWNPAFSNVLQMDHWRNSAGYVFPRLPKPVNAGTNKPGGRTSGQPPVFITVRRGLVLIGMLVYRLISTHCIRRRNISGSLLR